jgi:hypothetical protein
MDAFGGAFAFYDWNETTTSLTYTPGQVREKMTRNSSEFPAGFQTVDDSWMNNWLEGQNAKVGWKGASSGTGAKSYGEMLAKTDAFASCFASNLKKDGAFNYKNAFAEAAAVCIE